MDYQVLFNIALTLAAADYKFAIYNATAGSFIAQNIVPTQTPGGCTSIRVYAYRNPSISSGTLAAWGAQLNRGAVADYIKTEAAAVS